MGRTALSSFFVGVLSTWCSTSISYSELKFNLQISRIRVARLNICFGLQHWNFSYTMTLFELARRSEGLIRSTNKVRETQLKTKRRGILGS